MKLPPLVAQQFSYNGLNMENQDIGNYHYGAIGAGLWFASKRQLLLQAGWAQIRDGTSRPEWQRQGKYYPPYGDDPRDQSWIGKGYEHKR